MATSGGRGTFANVLLICQPGYEALLAREVTELHRGSVAEQGPGWARTDIDVPESAFTHLALFDPIEIRGDSVNALAKQVGDFFLTSLRGERIEHAWPSVWQGPAELVGLGRRISAVEAAFDEFLKKRLSRVARLSVPELPRGQGRVRGLLVFFVDFNRALVAREARAHGQRRMADDELAPSRSYLKVEEAFQVLGREPQPGETVCDLGAAPGGWSYSAAKRGARVLALDNGPLKGGALNHPLIEHRCSDAFGFRPAFAEASEGRPAEGEIYDWLFCDLVEEPHHVLKHIVEPWLTQRWCRRFVVNLKFGRVDAIALLAELRGPESPLTRCAPGSTIRHLYHDREELTLIGECVA